MYSPEGQLEHSSSLVDASVQSVECLVPVSVRRGREVCVCGESGMLILNSHWRRRVVEVFM